MRLLLWTLIWITSTGIADDKPLVLFPEHIASYPYFSKNYAKKHQIKTVKITTSKKFEGRPIYQMSQYEMLEFSVNSDFIGKKIIFESLHDTLETIIGWNGYHHPLRYMENTGNRWEYFALKWENDYPKSIDQDWYNNRDANALEALVHVGGTFKNTVYWNMLHRGNDLEFELHERFGKSVGAFHLSPYYQPKSVYINNAALRQTDRLTYTYTSDKKIQEIRSGTRLLQKQHVFEYRPSGNIKLIKTYNNGVLGEITDYFFNDSGTLRSILTTNLKTKEMTITEFRYSFY